MQIAPTPPQRTGILAKHDPSVILARLERGDSLRDVAADIGVTYEAVRIWLLDDAPDEYRRAQRKGLICRIVEADSALDAADDAVDVARARERAKFARWDAERRLPQLFGPRQHVDMTIHSTDLGDRLRAAKERVIGAGSTVASAQQTDASAAQQSAIAQDLTSTSG